MGIFLLFCQKCVCKTANQTAVTCTPSGVYMSAKRTYTFTLGVHIGYATCTYTCLFGWQFYIHISDKKSENWYNKSKFSITPGSCLLKLLQSVVTPFDPPYVPEKWIYTIESNAKWRRPKISPFEICNMAPFRGAPDLDPDPDPDPARYPVFF